MSDQTGLPENFGVLNRLSTSALAQKQQDQGQTNNCVFHTLATVVNIHCNQNINGTDWATKYNENWKQAPLKYRIKPNWATTPGQARRVLHEQSKISQASHNPADRFTVNCRIGLFSDEFLITTLQYCTGTYLIMSFLWLKGKISLISHKGVHEYPRNSSGNYGAHTMLLAAYNPEHRNKDGILHPWGFVNSWMKPGITDIFWMDEETWKRIIKLPTLMVNFTHPSQMVVNNT